MTAGGLHPPRETAVISGHRDWLATECPGGRLYSQLPALREPSPSSSAPTRADPPRGLLLPRSGDHDRVHDALERLLEPLRPLSLEELDERAALRRRVDNKYLVPGDTFTVLVERLGDDHDVLEIDGGRRFTYESVYFDSEDLRCFDDHVHDRRPRFKARTRSYLDAGACSFEVKLKNEAGETDKRQADHDPEAAGRLDPAACRLLEETLREAGVAPMEDPRAVLITRFERITLAARDGGGRMTSDLRLSLASTAGEETALREDLVLVEAKSEDGSSRPDTVLAELGVQPRSLSKYRTGVDLLLRRDPTGAEQDLRAVFG